MEYIIHSLGQLLIVALLANLVLLLVPKSIRKMFGLTLKSALWVLRNAIGLGSNLVRTMCENGKEIELLIPNKKTAPNKVSSNVKPKKEVKATKQSTKTSKTTNKTTTKTSKDKNGGNVIQFPKVENK